MVDAHFTCLTSDPHHRRGHGYAHCTDEDIEAPPPLCPALGLPSEGPFSLLTSLQSVKQECVCKKGITRPALSPFSPRLPEVSHVSKLDSHLVTRVGLPKSGRGFLCFLKKKIRDSAG